MSSQTLIDKKTINLSLLLPNVYILTMKAGQNWLNAEMLKEWGDCLDLIERKAVDNSVLISTATGKFFSNGLELLGKSMEEATDFIFKSVYPFYARLLVFRYPTLAAINGHAFAGGWMLALCHDYRIMNQDKGFVCMNEVKIPIPLSLGFAKILLTNQTHMRDVAVEGQRYNCKECFDKKWIDEMADQNNLLDSSVKFMLSRPKVKSSEIYGRIKRELYYDCYKVLSNPEHEAIPLFKSKL